jgi:hypothetical protein
MRRGAFMKEVTHMIQDTVTGNEVISGSSAEEEDELQDVLEGLSQLEQTPLAVLITASYLGDVHPHSAASSPMAQAANSD